MENDIKRSTFHSYQSFTDESFLDYFVQRTNVLGKSVISNVFFNFSLYYRRQKNINRSLIFLEKAIRADCFNEKSLNNYLVFRAQVFHNFRIESDFKTALHYLPWSSNLHYNYAVFLESQARNTQALRYYKHAAQLQPAGMANSPQYD
ncbi:hypothetical protein JXQ70_02785 [bacterium]|nr:hypothetical protein [bacterium]